MRTATTRRTDRPAPAPRRTAAEVAANVERINRERVAAIAADVAAGRLFEVRDAAGRVIAVTNVAP